MDRYQEFLEDIQCAKLSPLEKQLNKCNRWKDLNPDGKEVNEKGGKQSKLNLDCTLVTYPMIATLAKVLHEGKHYDTPGELPNWTLIDRNDHLNHCLNHIFLYLEHGTLEDLEHAFCRLGMAVHITAYED